MYYNPFSPCLSYMPADSYPTSKKANPLEGYTEFDTSFFETEDAKLIPTEQEQEMAKVVEEDKAKRAGRKKTSSGVTILDPDSPSAAAMAQPTPPMAPAGAPEAPFINSYNETNAMLRQAIMQTDQLAAEIKQDIDKIRSSSTMKSKYTYLTNLTGSQASLISTKIQAIREINSSISKSHDLELKRAKDMKDAQRDQMSDDARMMDMYNAFINSPMGMYQNPLNMPTVPDMLLGVNGPNPTMQAVPIVAHVEATQMTPEQLRMRMEGDPNIEEVVMYEPSTGRRWFEVVNRATGQQVIGYPRSDDFLLSDLTIDTRAQIARNRNINKNWRLVSTEGITEY